MHSRTVTGGQRLAPQRLAGDTFNTALYAQASFEKDWTVDYLTTVGDDALSAEMIDLTEAAGTGTSHVRKRYRAELRVSKTLAESAVNSLVGKRMVKMR